MREVACAESAIVSLVLLLYKNHCPAPTNFPSLISSTTLHPTTPSPLLNSSNYHLSSPTSIYSITFLSSMAGSPAQEASERQSRKRRGSHITPDKAKKSTSSSQSPSRTEKGSNKPAPVAPPVVKPTTSTSPAAGKGPSTTNNKTKGHSGDGSTKTKGIKPNLMGKASKAESGKLPAKDKTKKPDTKENKPEVKLDAKKPDTKDNKLEKKDDGQEKATKGKSPHRLSSPSGDH